jgi:hypothetical protein
MEQYPRYEKVNDHVIRIIVEQADEVTLSKLLETKKQIEEKLIQLGQTLRNINEILDNAKELGISGEEKDLNPDKIGE